MLLSRNGKKDRDAAGCWTHSSPATTAHATRTVVPKVKVRSVTLPAPQDGGAAGRSWPDAAVTCGLVTVKMKQVEPAALVPAAPPPRPQVLVTGSKQICPSIPYVDPGAGLELPARGQKIFSGSITRNCPDQPLNDLGTKVMLEERASCSPPEFSSGQSWSNSTVSSHEAVANELLVSTAGGHAAWSSSDQPTNDLGTRVMLEDRASSSVRESCYQQSRNFTVSNFEAVASKLPISTAGGSSIPENHSDLCPAHPEPPMEVPPECQANSSAPDSGSSQLPSNTAVLTGEDLTIMLPATTGGSAHRKGSDVQLANFKIPVALWTEATGKVLHPNQGKSPNPTILSIGGGVTALRAGTQPCLAHNESVPRHTPLQQLADNPALKGEAGKVLLGHWVDAHGVLLSLHTSSSPEAQRLWDPGGAAAVGCPCHLEVVGAAGAA